MPSLCLEVKVSLRFFSGFLCCVVGAVNFAFAEASPQAALASDTYIGWHCIEISGKKMSCEQWYMRHGQPLRPVVDPRVAKAEMELSRRGDNNTEAKAINREIILLDKFRQRVWSKQLPDLQTPEVALPLNQYRAPQKSNDERPVPVPVDWSDGAKVVAPLAQKSQPKSPVLKMPAVETLSTTLSGLKQPAPENSADYYTVQLGAFEGSADIAVFLEDRDWAHLPIVTQVLHRDGKVLRLVIFGVFGSYSAAQTAWLETSDKAQLQEVWIRRLQRE